MKVQELPAEAGSNAMEQEMAGAQDTIYLCNFRVSVDGEWLCLKELQDVEFNMQESITKALSTPSPDIPMHPFGMFYGGGRRFFMVLILLFVNERFIL